MAVIEVTKYNEVHFRVTSTDFSVRQELKDHFKYRPKGYFFSPKYQNKVWDGWIYMYSPYTCLLYVGLRSYLEEFARERNYTIRFPEQTAVSGSLAFVDALNIPKEVVPHIHDFQVRGFMEGVKNNRHLFRSPTGSGKSLVMYLLARWYKKKTLIIEPASVKQLYKEFLDYGCPEYLLYTIYGGQQKETVAPIVISTWNSIYKMPKKFFDDYEVVIGDECHKYEAKSLVSIMEKLTKAKYRFGFTGSLDDSKAHQLVLEGLFGPVIKLASTSELIERKILADLEIKAIVLKHKPPEGEDAEYEDMIKHLISSPTRNRFITNLTLSLKGNILVLFRYVEQHGDVLYSLMKEKAPDREIYYVHGGVETEEREQVRAIVEKSNNAIIVASTVFSEGTNIKQLDNVILATPYKSNIKILQSIGRGLRRTQTKTKCVVYDIADDVDTRAKRKNYSLLHFESRVKTYKRENFPFKVYKINVEGKI